MRENTIENLNQKETVNPDNIKACLENSCLSQEEIKYVADYLTKLKSDLKNINCNIELIFFFGSAVTNRDSYSDLDIMILYQGELPEKNERQKILDKNSDKTISSLDGESKFAPGTKLSENVTLLRNLYFHIDFRNMGLLNKIFKDVKNGAFNSFYLMECFQNGIMAGNTSIIDDNIDIIKQIPNEAKENFLNSRKDEIIKTLDSMAKALIRDDNIRYLDLLLKNIYNTIDYYYVINDKYPSKKKGLREKLNNFSRSENLYNAFFELLKVAMINPMKSFKDFRKMASKITGIDFNYDEENL